MIETPTMFEISQTIEQLRARIQADPGDYMAEFEFDELVRKYDMLAKIERLGWKIVKGGRQLSEPCTEKERQTS